MHWLDWRRWLVYSHRWLGIVGGVLFVAWFFSGVVMMYTRMPGLANEERLARATALDLSTATVSPLEAARAASVIDDDIASRAELTRPGTETTAQKRAAEVSVERVRVGMLGNRPVYRFGAGRNETMVFADTATLVEPIDRTRGRGDRSPLRAWLHRARPLRRLRDRARSVDAPVARTDADASLLRVQYADANRTWLYVDPARGAIVQRTDDTRRLRRWLYQGLHSLDFPALYYKRPLWDIVVIGLSIGGLALSATTLLPAWRRLRRRARDFVRAAPSDRRASEAIKG